MAAQKQGDQLERTFSSYVRIQDVVLKTYLGRWTIGRSGERGSGISVLPARYDDDDDTPSHLYTFTWHIHISTLTRTHIYTHAHIHTHIYTEHTHAYVDKIFDTFGNLYKVKLATVVEGDPKAPFSIATTPRCRRGYYSFPWNSPLYPWYVPYIAECKARRYQVPFLKSLVWGNLGLNPGLPDHWQTLYPLGQYRIIIIIIIIIIIGAFGTVTKGLLKGLKDLEVGGRAETIQTTALLRTARILRRVLETWEVILSLKLQWKTIS